MKKKSGKRAAATFLGTVERLNAFTQEIDAAQLSDQAVTWCYEIALVKVAVAFEKLMLECLVTAINNDSGTISARSGITFPAHLTTDVCEYLITGGGYFDYRGRDGLIKTVREYVPNDHWLLLIVKDPKHKSAIEQLIALRNLAAHESPKGKRITLDVLDQTRMGSAGSWIKCETRFAKLCVKVCQVAADVEANAPY